MLLKKLKQNKIILLGVILFLFLSLFAAFYLSQRPQEIRKEAAPANEAKPDILTPSSSFEERKRFFDKDYFKNYLWETSVKLTPEIIEADKKAEYKKLPQYQRLLDRTQVSTPVIVPILLVANGEIYYPQHLTTINIIMTEVKSWYQRETGLPFQIEAIITEQSSLSAKQIWLNSPHRFLGPNIVTMVFFQGGGGYAGCYSYGNQGGSCVMGDWLLEAYNCANADFSGCIRSEIQKENVSTDPAFLDPDNNGINNFLMIPWYWGCWYDPFTPQNYQRCRAQYNQAETIKQALYTAAHELGHGFDLPHPEGYGAYIGPSIMTGWRTWPNNILSKQIFYDESSHVARTPFFTGDGSLFNSDHPGFNRVSSITKRKNLLTIDGYNFGSDPNNLRVVINTTGGLISLPIFCLSGSQILVIAPDYVLSGSLWITKQGLKSKISFATIYDNQDTPIISATSIAPIPTPTLMPILAPSERCRLLLGGTSYTIGETIRIMVQQNPRFAGNSSCYYGQMEVKKGGQTICTTSGFNIIPSCQTKICEWNTQGTTAGEYLLSSYYGGHNDGCPNNPCCDNTYTCYTNVILNSSTPTPIRTPTPTPTLTPCNFAGVGEVRDYNNKQVLENKSGFWWLNYRGQNGQFPTGGPVRTEWRPSVLPTQYIINNAWIALTPAPGYVLKDTFCEKPVDCSYGTPGCEESNVCTGSYLRGPTPIINTRFNCNLSYTYGWYVDRSAPTKSPTPTLTPTCSPFPSKTPTPTLSPLIPTDTPVPTSTLTPSPTSASMPTPTPSRFPCNSNCAYNSQCATNYCWFVSGTCRNPNCPANLWCRCF